MQGLRCPPGPQPAAPPPPGVQAVSPRWRAGAQDGGRTGLGSPEHGAILHTAARLPPLSDSRHRHKNQVRWLSAMLNATGFLHACHSRKPLALALQACCTAAALSRRPAAAAPAAAAAASARLAAGRRGARCASAPASKQASALQGVGVRRWPGGSRHGGTNACVHEHGKGTSCLRTAPAPAPCTRLQRGGGLPQYRLERRVLAAPAMHQYRPVQLRCKLGAVPRKQHVACGAGEGALGEIRAGV